MSGGLPSDVAQALLQSIQDLTDAVRGQTSAAERSADRSERAREAGAIERAGGGLFGGALAGLGGIEGALSSASGVVGGQTQIGAGVQGVANVVGATAFGAQAGGAAGAAAAGGAQAVQTAGAISDQERSYELQLVDAANPATNPVIAEQTRRRIAIERDPATRVGDVARSPFTAAALGGALFGNAIGDRLREFAGPDPRVANREREIAEEPAARAAARLQGAVREITSRGGTVSDEFVSARAEFFLNAEEGVRGGDELIRDKFLKRGGERTGIRE